MGVGSFGIFDRVDYTASSEYGSRGGETVDTLQVHHTAYPSDEGSRRLMDPGGRTVSANALLLQDGTLVEVVPLRNRAFTSASGYDRRSATVEVVNQTGGPEWRISETQRRRLARFAQDLYRLGMLGALTRDYIIGHNETPGSYPTACPGPDMHLDHVADLAQGASLAGSDYTPITPDQSEEDDTMRHLFVRDQAGTGTLWTLANTATGEIIQTRDQGIANTWAEAWGSAKPCSMQAFLNALAAVQVTTAPRGEALARLQAAIDDVRAQLAAPAAAASAEEPGA